MKVCCLLAVNELVSWVYPNPVRHLVRGARALLLVLKSPGLRLTVYGMANTLPRIWQVLVIYLTVTTFYALLAMEYLHEYYRDLDTEFTGTFNDFPRAWLAMFVASTTENYPFLMYPPLFRIGGGLHTQSADGGDGMGSGDDGDGDMGIGTATAAASSSDAGSGSSSSNSDGSSDGSSGGGGTDDGSWGGKNAQGSQEEEAVVVEALHVCVVLFFLSYLVLVVYLILRLKVAAVYDSWKEVRLSRVVIKCRDEPTKPHQSVDQSNKTIKPIN